ncbi:MAG: VWA domain-containing protein [Planctomycetota bacterium]
MSFLGWSLGQLLLAGGVASAASVILYLFRRRERVLPVSFLSFWEGALAERQPRALLRKLRGLLGLLLALVILWLTSLALGRPVVGGASERPGSVVLAVDVSTSMAALREDLPRIERARRLAREAVDSYPSIPIALVTFTDAVNVLVPFTKNRGEIRARLASLDASQCPGPTARAMETVRGIARARDSHLVVIGDADTAEALGDASEASSVTFLNAGEAGDNLAITEFAMRGGLAGGMDYETMVRIANYGREARELAVKIYSVDHDRETIVDAVSARLAPGIEKTLFFPSLGGLFGRVVARLHEPSGERLADALSADNEAYIYAEARAPVRVLLVSPGNLFLESALAVDRGVVVARKAPGEVGNAEGFDVVVFDGLAPKAFSHPRVIEFPRDEEIEALSDDGRIGPTRLMIAQDHPLFLGVSMRDIAIGRAMKLSAAAGDIALAKGVAGDPLIVESRSGAGRRILFAFDPCACEWPLRAAFPLFWANVVRLSADRWTSDPFASAKCGEDYPLKACGEATEIAFKAPDGSTGSIVSAPAVAARLPCRQIGFYEVKSGGMVSYVGSNLFDGAESDLRGKSEAPDGSAAHPATVRVRGIPELWRALVVCAAAVAVLEWFTYTRRWTV